MNDNKKDLIRVFVKGGIISPTDLYKICEITEKVGNRYFHFGSRQDILFPANDFPEQDITSIFEGLDVTFHKGRKNDFQNIVSSFVSLDIFPSTSWIKADTYHYILESFENLPQYKINLVDPKQNLVPFFTGHINFVASSSENYWYLFVRFPQKEKTMYPWPRLIHSHNIAKIAHLIGSSFADFPDITIDQLTMHQLITDKPKTQELELPESFSPYYEGLNMVQNQYWLGLYWRNNKYGSDFMKAACRLCMDTNISTIHITPWKSFIIKNIKPEYVLRWEKLMGKFGINMRHSFLELNWHLPVNDDDALKLKKFLVYELDQQDISTFGLTFTIKTSSSMVLFTSIAIEQHEPGAELYNILLARDFNPNSNDYFYYAKDVKKETLPALLLEISKIYFSQLSPEKELTNPAETTSSSGSKKSRYQCKNCLTIYDPQFGDSLSNIPPGLGFDELPIDYKCSVCESGKEYFRLM